jgi:tetratricopeptide (TPR) repeat protein
VLKILLLAALTGLVAPAFPEEPRSRQEALAALGSASAEARAAAVLWIARHGGSADAAPLYERLRDQSALVRGYAEQALWLVWSRSGDASVDRLMERGIEQMQAGRHHEAIATFSDVIRRRPAFAEGWNKRATVLYLAGDYRRSLADCAEVLKRNPRHFGALSGAGLVHLRLEQYPQALESFRRALEVNPNMPGIEMEVLRLEALLRGRST